MKTFKEHIKESFDSPYPWNWSPNAGIDSVRDGYVAFATTSTKKKLQIVFDKGNSDEWSIEFTVNRSINATGEGDQMKIFATVLDVIKAFINKKHPEHIEFSASKANSELPPAKRDPNKRNSRINLYTKLIKRFANQNGYKLVNAAERPLQIDYKLTKK